MPNNTDDQLSLKILDDKIKNLRSLVVDEDRVTGSAVKLALPVNISLTGDVIGSVDFDGSENVIIQTTITKEDVILPATVTPKAGYAGGGVVGISPKYAREDHQHPLQTTISGNAGSATRLATGFNLNLIGHAAGTVFIDGSHDLDLRVTVNANSHSHTISNISGLQAALDAKSVGTHGPHVSLTSTAPKNITTGSAAVGTAETSARADHVHHIDSNILANTIKTTTVDNATNLAGYAVNTFAKLKIGNSAPGLTDGTYLWIDTRDNTLKYYNSSTSTWTCIRGVYS